MLFGNSGRILGGVGVAVGIGAGVCNVYKAPPGEKICAISQEATGWAGGMAGGVSGAEAGFWLGLAIGGPVGAIMGSVGGGVIGGYLGGQWGHDLGTMQVRRWIPVVADAGDEWFKETSRLTKEDRLFTPGVAG
jgi:hypothetical protein